MSPACRPRPSPSPRPGPPSNVCDGVVTATTLTAHHGPVLLPDVVVDLDWDPLAVEAVAPVALGARDPVLVAGGHVDVVRLEPGAAQAAQHEPAVVDRAAGLRER